MVPVFLINCGNCDVVFCVFVLEKYIARTFLEWWFQSPGCRSSGVSQLRLQAVREVISSTRDSQHESTEEYSFRRVLARHSNLTWPNDWFPSLFSLQYSWSLVPLFWRWCSINHILEHHFLACIFRYYCGHVVLKVYDERSAQRCATIAPPPSFFCNRWICWI